MKRLQIIIFCLFAGLSTISAQNIKFKVSGIIQYNDGTPIDYAEVVFFKDNIATQNAFSNNLGIFSISVPEGNYKFVIRRLKDVLRDEPITVSKDIDLGILKAENIKNLEEVKVVVKKKLIERKLDRFVVNVENSPLLTGSNAFDIVKNAPGVYLGNNEVLNIMGKSGVQIMIDGRIQHMTADELSNMLKSMSSDQIKSLEIITIPSSKYDAEGNAGIINIVTRRNGAKGWNANVGITGYQGRYGRLISSAGINYKDKVIDFTSSYTIGQVNSFEKIEQSNRLLNRSTNLLTQYLSSNYEKRKEFYQTFSGQLDFRLNSSSNIGLAGNLFNNKSPRPAENTTLSSDGSYFISKNEHDLNLYNFAIDTYYHYKIDTLGKIMKLNVGVANYKVEDDQKLQNIFYLNNNVLNNESVFQSFFDNKTVIASANIDFELPLKKANLETGAKIANTIAKNDFLFQNYDTNAWFTNAELSNRFRYRETNMAAYFTYKKDISKKISFQLGLRGEYTLTNGLSQTTSNKTVYNYFQLFPTVYFQYSTEKDYQFNLSYSRRINRPSFDYLNPFISYQNPLFSNQGNPLLRPAFTNSLEMNNIFKDKYIITVFGNYVTRYFSEFPVRVGKTDETRYTFDNLGKSLNFGLQIIIPVKLTGWWNITNTSLIMHQNYDLSYNEINQNLNNVFWLNNLTNSFKISKNVNAELLGKYRSSSLQGFYSVGDFFDMSASINIKILNDNATISLGAYDIFYTNRSIVDISYPNQQLNFTRYNDTRLFKLSFKYKFGNTGIKSKSKVESGNAEEQNRAGKG